MTAQARDTYPLGRSERETERLIWSAKMARDSIVRFLEEAGVALGMKVLDVGAGAGDLSMLAAEIVGPSGSVHGIDLNDTIQARARARAAEAGATNVSFSTRRIPDGLAGLDMDFDAIVGRRVLCYIPDAAEALRALLNHAKPGAVVAFREVDWTIWSGHSFPLAPTYDQVWKWVYKAFEAGGTDMAMGTRLGPMMAQAGLPFPYMRATAGIGGEDSIVPLFALLASVRETILRERIAGPEELDAEGLQARIRSEFAAAGSVGTGGFEVTAWTRKP